MVGMASVILVKAGRSDKTVTDPTEFVNLIYGQGYLPKTGTVAQAWQTLDADAPVPPVDPNRTVSLGQVQELLGGKADRPVPDNQLPARLSETSLRGAFAHLNQAGELVIVVDGVETIVGGSGDGGLTTEQVQDLVASMILAGTNVTTVYDDTASTLTLSAASAGSTDPEVVRDTIAAALVAGSGVTITPNDDGNTITISVSGGSAGYGDTFLDASLGGTSGTQQSQQIGKSFTTVNLPSVTTGAANWDAATSQYVVPSTGRYLIVAKLRIMDGQVPAGGLNIGVGAHTTNADGAHVVWSKVPADGGQRHTLDYQRQVPLTAGNRLRLFAYVDSNTAIWFATANLTILRTA